MYRFDAMGWRPDERTHIYVLDVPEPGHEQPDEAREPLTSGFADDGPASWSPDGKWIAYSSVEADSADAADLGVSEQALFVIASDGTGAPRRVTQPGGGWTSPVFSPNGRWIAAFGTDVPEDIWGTNGPKLWIFPSQGGAGVCLTRNLDRATADLSVDDLNEFGEDHPIFTSDGTELLFPVSSHGEVALYRIRLSEDGTAAGEPEALWEGQRVISQPRLVRDRLVGLVGDATHPPEVWGASYQSGGELSAHTWSAFNEEWCRRVSPGEPESFYTEASDGQRVHGWILPARHVPADGSPPPGLLEIHGGPHVQYSWSLMFEFHYLASQGFTVIYSNPRGSQGYGDEFAAAVRDHFADHAEKDLNAVIDYAIAQGKVDPDRLGVLGGSGGGYQTSWMVSQSNRFKAGCSQRALNDWRTFHLTSDIGWQSPWQTGTTPWGDRERMRSISPLPQADKIETPLLVVHSEQDLRCAIEQAEQQFIWLRYRGAPVEFLRFPDESHGLSRGGTPSRRMHRLYAMADWFAHHLLGKPRTVPTSVGAKAPS